MTAAGVAAKPHDLPPDRLGRSVLAVGLMPVVRAALSGTVRQANEARVEAGVMVGAARAVLAALLALVVSGPAAMADGAGRCYPPPCRVDTPEITTMADSGGVSTAPPPSPPLMSVAPAERSPVPYVAFGVDPV